MLQRLHVLARAIVVAAVATAVAAAPSVATAHTDIDYTLPADGEEIAQPVEEITVAFNDPVTLVGAGFEVLTPAGEVVEPSVFSEDGAVYFLEVPQALAGGVAAVRYEVAAADGHVLEGGFSFTVTAAPVTTAPAATTPAPTEPPAVPATTAPAPGTAAPVTTATGASPTTAPSVIAPAPTSAPAVADDEDGGGSSTGIVIGVIAAIAVAGVAFVVLRARRSAPA